MNALRRCFMEIPQTKISLCSAPVDDYSEGTCLIMAGDEHTLRG
jgi:hypothetical protein